MVFLVRMAINTVPPSTSSTSLESGATETQSLALISLDQLLVKGRAQKTGYARTEFGSGWKIEGSCDVRNIVLSRDMTNVSLDKDCRVLNGKLVDPYSGHAISFVRGVKTSQEVQVDHVVSLSNAWQTGAQQLSSARRVEFSNDLINLLAVSNVSNQTKGDADAATWLPPNKSYRCEYVARQITIKQRYGLWVTFAEKQAMQSVLKVCPLQRLIFD